MFWIHASSTARIEEGYRRIAEIAKLAGLEDPKVNIMRLVCAWLRDESNGKWIIIVDYADDLSILSDLSGGTYIETEFSIIPLIQSYIGRISSRIGEWIYSNYLAKPRGSVRAGRR